MYSPAPNHCARMNDGAVHLKGRMGQLSRGRPAWRFEMAKKSNCFAQGVMGTVPSYGRCHVELLTQERRDENTGVQVESRVPPAVRKIKNLEGKGE